LLYKNVFESRNEPENCFKRTDGPIFWTDRVIIDERENTVHICVVVPIRRFKKNRKWFAQSFYLEIAPLQVQKIDAFFRILYKLYTTFEIVFFKTFTNAAIKNVIDILYFLPSRKSLYNTDLIKTEQFIALSRAVSIR